MGVVSAGGAVGRVSAGGAVGRVSAGGAVGVVSAGGADGVVCYPTVWPLWRAPQLQTPLAARWASVRRRPPTQVSQSV